MGKLTSLHEWVRVSVAARECRHASKRAGASLREVPMGVFSRAC